MTMWEWACVVEGWNRANGGGKATTYPTDDEFEEAVSRVRQTDVY